MVGYLPHTDNDTRHAVMIHDGRTRIFINNQIGNHLYLFLTYEAVLVESFNKIPENDINELKFKFK